MIKFQNMRTQTSHQIMHYSCDCVTTLLLHAKRTARCILRILNITKKSVPYTNNLKTLDLREKFFNT